MINGLYKSVNVFRSLVCIVDVYVYKIKKGKGLRNFIIFNFLKYFFCLGMIICLMKLLIEIVFLCFIDILDNEEF